MISLVKKPLMRIGVWDNIVSFQRSMELSKALPHGATVLIHIGKCGGQSLREGMSSSQRFSNIKSVHVEKPVFRDDLEYIVVARGPISRTISAFSWRHKIVVSEGRQRDMFPGEYEVLCKYRSLDNIARALYEKDGSLNSSAHEDMRKIHHIKQDIAFYLKDFLGKVDPNQVAAVLMQENLDDDIFRVFGYKNKLQLHRSPAASSHTQLSDQSIRNLTRYLREDYEALLTLYSWGKIERSVFLKIFESPGLAEHI